MTLPLLLFAAATLPTGPGPYHLATGDLNGDGFADLAAPCRGELLLPTERRPANDTVTVYLTRGSAELVERRELHTGFGPYTAVIGDLDGDGAGDLAVVNFQANDGRDLTVFWGPKLEPDHLRIQGAPFAYDKSRTAKGEPVYPTPGLTSLAFVDADSDGRRDMVAVAWSSDFFVLLRNKGGRRFEQRLFPVNPGPRDVAVADFNGDSIADLALTIYSSNLVEVWFGDGKAGYTRRRVFHSQGHVPYHLKAADLDRDGHIDLVVGNRGPSDNVAVFFNQGGGEFRFAGSHSPGSPRRGEATVDEIRDVLVTDFDGDRVPDLMAACHVSHKVVIWKGTGKREFGRAFGPPRVWEFPGQGPRALIPVPAGIATAMFDSNGIAIVSRE